MYQSVKIIDGALFHHVELICYDVLCPPYDETNELACVSVYQVILSV